MFGGRSKESILLEAFYKVAFEYGYINKLLCLEAGAEPEDILRDTDFYVDGTAKSKDFGKLDDCYFGAYAYLPGRLVWFNEWVEGKRLAKLFTSNEFRAVNADTAVDALINKWPDIERDPDTYIAERYGPSFIYYDHIENVRLMYDNEDKQMTVQIRMLSGFNYKTPVSSKFPIQSARSTLVDRDDLRFLNARIAERNLRR